MPLARFLVLIVIGFLVWLLFRGRFKPGARDAARPPEAREGEDMVACADCGVNMPRSEAKEEGGRFTCRDRATCKHAG
jgi:uncharacterized protein